MFEETSQMTQMSIQASFKPQPFGIRLDHRYSDVLILLLVVVDPSPATSTCWMKGQFACPLRSKVTEIIT